MSKDKLEDLTYEKLVELNWVKGMSLNKIALTIYNTHAATVINHAKKLGFVHLDGNKMKSKLKDVTYEMLYQMHCVEDRSLNDIATIYSVKTCTVRALAKKLNVPIKVVAVKKLKDLTYEMLYQMYWVEEMSLSTISKKYSVTVGGLLRRVKKLGFKTRDKKTATSIAVSGDKNSMRNPVVLEKRSGVNHHFYGKARDNETKDKISKSLTEHFEENGSHNLGRIHLSRRGQKRDPEIVAKVTATKKLQREERFKNEPDNPEGISLNERIRKLSEFRYWRVRCFIRDKNTCQACDAKKVDFHVDHIVPFSYLLNKHNITSLQEAIECKELWDESNGRVLCIPCHKKTDTYGYKALNYTEPTDNLVES